MPDFNSMAAAMSPSATLSQGSYGLDPELQALDMKRKMALGLMSQPRTPTHSRAEILNRALAPLLGALSVNHLNNTLSQWSQSAAPEIASAVNSSDPLTAFSKSSNPIVRAMMGQAAPAAITAQLETRKLLAAQGKQIGPDGKMQVIPGADTSTQTLSGAESRGSAEGALRARIIENLAPHGLTLTNDGRVAPIQGGPEAIGSAQGATALAAAPGEAAKAGAVSHAEQLAGVAPDVAAGAASKAGGITHAEQMAENAPDVAAAAASKAGGVAGSEATARLPAEILSGAAREGYIPRVVNPTDRLISGGAAMPPVINDAIQSILKHYNGGQPPASGGISPAAPSGAASAIPRIGAALPGAAGSEASNATGEIPAAMTPQQFKANESLAEEFSGPELKQYKAAQGGLASTALMNNAIDQMNQHGWSATGPLNPAVMDFANTVNDIGKRFGVSSNLFDPKPIGSWELMNKEATRAGFSLASQMGSREGQQIVSAAIKAVPNASSTYLGARQVSSAIEQMMQREVDLYNYKSDVLHNGSSLIKAESDFNKAHPITDYTNRALANAVPDPHATELLAYKDQPDKLAEALKEFDGMYGKGVGESILNGSRTQMIGIPPGGPPEATLIPAQPNPLDMGGAIPPAPVPATGGP